MPVIKKENGDVVSYVAEITDKEFQQYLYYMERRNDAEVRRREIDMEKKLHQIFLETEKHMQQKIEGFYVRFANRQGIVLEEAKKKASQMDIRDYEARAAKAVAEKDYNAQTEEWLRLYNLKMRASREEALLADLRLDLADMYYEAEQLGIEQQRREALEETKRQAGILRSDAKITDRLTSYFESDTPYTRFSEIIWNANGHYHELNERLDRIMTRMLTDMDGYRKHWKQLSREMGVAEYKAKRLIVNEERIRIHEAELEAFKQNGFDNYVYVSETDKATCPACAELNGKMFKVEDASAGVNFPQMHVGCRCSVFGYHTIERFNKETGQWEPQDYNMGFDWQDTVTNPSMKSQTGRYKRLEETGTFYRDGRTTQ